MTDLPSKSEGNSSVNSITALVGIRKSSTEGKKLVGVERVDVKLAGKFNGPFKVRKGDFEFLVDEPIERGGTNKAPNPLAYFLAGAATCLMSQYMIWATANNISIETFEIIARGHFDRTLVHGSFYEIIYDARLESREDSSTIVKLAKQAQEMCYAHNTLVKAGVRMTTNVYLNGSKISTLNAAK